jgi:tetratricopeptide (TPR) repeat protein
VTTRSRSLVRSSVTRLGPSQWTFCVLLWLTFSLAISVSSISTVTKTEILQRVATEHQQEVDYGLKVFGNGLSDTPMKWSDSDFIAHSVGYGNAGPDEADLGKRGHEIFQTAKPVISVQECEELVAEAREAIAQGLKESSSKTDPDGQPSNSELGEARVSTLPKARAWLENKMREELFPLLQSRFGVRADDLCLYDALIIGYGYFGGRSRSQPVHRDASLLSLNVALSPPSSYEGGGTYVEGLSDTARIEMEQGSVMCHAGGAPHAGRGTRAGERWVLVLFCLDKKQPQLARRCHALGERLKHEKDLNGAAEAFQAGLSVAPNDHLLHWSLASVHTALGNDEQARESLEKAAACYPHCPKADIALAKMHMSERRPREALDYFDQGLAKIGTRADRPDTAWMPLCAAAFDAKTYGAHAAILCADAAEADFVFEKIPRTIERLNEALLVAPGNEYVLNLLSKAHELLAEASAKENAQ